jgi:hypothetical protein
MSESPSAAELTEAVREFLEAEILPVVDDQRLRFRTLVAINALGIVERELDAPAPGLAAEELAELARRIRAGEPPADALRLLKEHVAAKLRVASPRYLDRYRESEEG